MSDDGAPAKVRLTDGLGGFFTEAMLASATLKTEQEGRAAYRGYCPSCEKHTLRAFHRGHGIVGKVCTACNVLVVLKDA